MTPRREANNRPHGVSPVMCGNTILQPPYFFHNADSLRRCTRRLRSKLHSSLEIMRHFAVAYPARPRSSRSCVLLRGLRSCLANQARAVARRRVRTLEQLFQESSAQKIFPLSVASSSCSGRKSLHSISRSVSASVNATRNISSTASASRTRAPCSSSVRRCSTNSSVPCVRAPRRSSGA